MSSAGAGRISSFIEPGEPERCPLCLEQHDIRRGSNRATSPAPPARWAGVGAGGLGPATRVRLRGSRPARPPAICSQCGEPVTLRLGAVRRHHYAHRPDSDCLAGSPETALHLNTKFYLARQLEQFAGGQLAVRERCAGAEGRPECLRSRHGAWEVAWDAVRVEYRLDPLRPDIAALAGGRIAGALEVRVTHAVDTAKAKILAQLGVPWLEVEADEALYAGPTPWTPTQTLPVVSRGPAVWRCSSRQYTHNQAVELARTRYMPIALRLVDYYFPSGNIYRAIYWVEDRWHDGELAGRRLREEDRTLLELRAPLPPDARDRLRRACQHDLDRRRKSGAVVTAQWRRNSFAITLATPGTSCGVIGRWNCDACSAATCPVPPLTCRVTPAGQPTGTGFCRTTIEKSSGAPCPLQRRPAESTPSAAPLRSLEIATRSGIGGGVPGNAAAPRPPIAERSGPLSSWAAGLEFYRVGDYSFAALATLEEEKALAPYPARIPAPRKRRASARR